MIAVSVKLRNVRVTDGVQTLDPKEDVASAFLEVR